MDVALPAGLATGIGSLPHREADAAVRLAISACPDMPFVPTLPRRSPREGMIAQAVVGIAGVTLGHYGSLAVDVARLDPVNPVSTDLEHDAFGGFAAFIRMAAVVDAPIKWQFVGPVTLGLALARAGAPVDLAFEIAGKAVRSHVAALHEHLAAAFAGSRQVVLLDEPLIGEVLAGSGPVAQDVGIDILSGALAAVEQVAVSGVHCCGPADWPAIMEAGPTVLSMPLSAGLVDMAGYLCRHLAAGGFVAWGAVATDGLISGTSERAWRQLSKIWCALVERGCDPLQLRQQSIITPECGLAMHDLATAERVLVMTGEVADRVRGQALATRLTVGA